MFKEGKVLVPVLVVWVFIVVSVIQTFFIVGGFYYSESSCQPNFDTNQNKHYDFEVQENITTTTADFPDDLPTPSTTPPARLKIVSRKEWLAQSATSPFSPLQTPVQYVIIMHTAIENCSGESACILHVRYIQTFDIESIGLYDIGYNFLVGGDGFAYEGRGWTKKGAHSYGYNARSIGIALIGTFNKILPTQRKITAAKQLIEKEIELRCIARDYKLLTVKQLVFTSSPDQALYEDIETWPHWSEHH